MTHTYQMELKAIEGDRVHLVGTGREEVEPGSHEVIEVPGLAMEVVSWKGALTVDVWVDLTSPVVEASNEAHRSNSLVFTDGEVASAYDTHVDSLFTIWER